MSSRNLVLPIFMRPSSGDESGVHWLEKGNELCNSGQMEEAIKAYEFALSIDSTLSDAWNNKGLILANLGRLAPALQCFDDVLKVSVSPQTCLYSEQQIGWFWLNKKGTKMLWTALKPLLTWTPILPEPGYNKALAMQCLGRDREAMAAMKTADTLEGKAGGCRRRC